MPSVQSIKLWMQEEDARIARRQQERQQEIETERLNQAGIPQLAQETARLQRELDDRAWAEQAKQIRRNLVMGPSSDWNAPKYTPCGDSTAVITQKCVTAWREFVGNDSGLSADLTESYLKLFLQQNAEADLTNPETFRSAVAYIRQRLTRPTPAPAEPIEQPTRARDAAGRFLPDAEVKDTPESHNPYPDPSDVRHNRWFNSDEYRELCKRDEFEGRQRELSVLFRGTVEEICQDAKMEFSSENMRALMSIWENFRPRLPWSREGLRRAFFSRWYKDCPDGVMTQEEYTVATRIDNNAGADVSAEDFAHSVGANPNFRRAGAPLRDAGVR